VLHVLRTGGRLTAGRSGLSSDQIGVDDAYPESERLTFLLTGVTASDDRVLAALVNDIELIRFTRHRGSQPTAVDQVLLRAEEVFERYVPDAQH
jgi:hypothetical protein